MNRAKLQEKSRIHPSEEQKTEKKWQKRQKSTILAKIMAHKERLFVKMFLYLQCYSPFKGGNRHNIGSVIGFFQDW